MSIFTDISRLQKILGLAADLQKLDADGDGQPDLKEYLALAAKAKKQSEDLHATLQEIAVLFGDDIEAIQARFR